MTGGARSLVIGSPPHRPFAWRLSARVVPATLVVLVRAWRMRSPRAGSGPPRIVLPRVGPRTGPPPPVVAKLVMWLDLLVSALLFWKRSRCFYRCYALATILRGCGVPVVLNLGCRDWDDPRVKVTGHSWLTLRGEPVFERGDPEAIHPIRLGSSGDVTYWLSRSDAPPGPGRKLRKRAVRREGGST